MIDFALLVHKKYQDSRLFKMVMTFIHHIPLTIKNIYGDVKDAVGEHLLSENYNCLQYSELTLIHI